MKLRATATLLLGPALLALSPAFAAEIPDGTEVKVRLLETVSSLTAEVQDSVLFEAAEDVVVDGATVIAKGAHGRGTVTRAQKRKSFGRRGKLDFTLDLVEAVDGSSVPLRASRELRGAATHVSLGVPTPLSLPLGLLVKGGDVVVLVGTGYTIFVDGQRFDDVVELALLPADVPD